MIYNVSKLSVHSYSFQLVKVENLPIAITKDAKKLQVVIEMTLYHADKILVETKRTKPMPLSSFGTIEWFDVVMFDIKINNLPKVKINCYSIEIIIVII